MRPRNCMDQPVGEPVKVKNIATCILGLGTLAACETTVVGSGFGSPPPMIVQSERGLAWNSAASFGPVPPADQARGDAICAAVPTVNGGTPRAIGYHPAATDQKGVPIEGGGFFCG